MSHDWEECVHVMKDGSVMNDARRYRELKASMIDACYAYYVADAPVMQDSDYDIGFQNLQAYENRHPHLDRTDSPTQYVGWDKRMEAAWLQRLSLA